MVSGTHKLAWQATFYLIWSNRNERTQSGRARSHFEGQKWNHTMKVSVPASAARTPPDTGASNMTGITKLSTNNEICQSLYMYKPKVSQAYLKIKLWLCIKIPLPPLPKKI